MGEMSLYTGIEDMLWPRIAERRSVLIQKIHQLFGDLSENGEVAKVNYAPLVANARKNFLPKPLIIII